MVTGVDRPPALPAWGVWSKQKDLSTVRVTGQDGAWGQSPLTRALPQGHKHGTFFS